MLFEVLKYQVLRSVAACCRKAAAIPEPLPPVPFADLWELLVNFSRRPTVLLADRIADGRFGRHRHEHVDMITRQNALDDLDALLGTDLPIDFSDVQSQVTLKHLEAGSVPQISTIAALQW